MSDGTRTPSSRDQQRIVWHRLKDTLRPQATVAQVIVGLLCLLLGVSIAAQMGRNDESLEGATQQELVRLLDESGRHASDLELENAELERTLETLRSGREGDVAAQDAAEQRLADLEILAGTAPAQGRGIVVSIADPALGIDWPIPLEECVLSEADQTHPPLARATPARRGCVLILGAGGQLGRALADRLPGALGGSAITDASVEHAEQHAPVGERRPGPPVLR